MQHARTHERTMTEAVSTVNLVTQPLYTYADTDRLAGVSRGTAKRWLTGSEYVDPSGQHVVRPPVTAVPEERAAASFLDLVEVIAIGRLKRAGFSLRRIREIVDHSQSFLGVHRPLTTLKFRTDGREIFVDRGEILLEVGGRESTQAWAEFLGPFLEELDYADEIARRWWPLGRGARVVIDPAYGFGFPVVAGSGVRTEIILERFEAGDPNEQIAADFNLDPLDVTRALQFEQKLARAA
jgi:uncharacterized protein (DUF433 family)